MNRSLAYLALDFLAMLLLTMIAVFALKAVVPILGVWILVVVGALLGIVYPWIVRHFAPIEDRES